MSTPTYSCVSLMLVLLVGGRPGVDRDKLVKLERAGGHLHGGADGVRRHGGHPRCGSSRGVPIRHSACPGRTTMKSDSMHPTSGFQRESWRSMLLPKVM